MVRDGPRGIFRKKHRSSPRGRGATHQRAARKRATRHHTDGHSWYESWTQACIKNNIESATAPPAVAMANNGGDEQVELKLKTLKFGCVVALVCAARCRFARHACCSAPHHRAALARPLLLLSPALHAPRAAMRRTIRSLATRCTSSSLVSFSTVQSSTSLSLAVPLSSSWVGDR